MKKTEKKNKNYGSIEIQFLRDKAISVWLQVPTKWISMLIYQIQQKMFKAIHRQVH